MHTTDQPLASIIIPIYNVEAYLSECLDSILSQTYPHWECLLINDGSIDSSGAIAQSYAEKDKRFRYLEQPNQGLSAARNTGLDEAKGDFIAFVDSDDYVYPDFLEQTLKAYKETEVDLVSFHFDRTKDLSIGGEHKTLNQRELQEYTTPVIYTKGEILRHYALGELISPAAWNKLYRRKAWQQLRFPVGRYYEDSAITFHIISTSPKIAILPHSYYVYRTEREGSIAHKLSKRIYDLFYNLEAEREFVLQKQLEFLGEIDLLLVQNLFFYAQKARKELGLQDGVTQHLLSLCPKYRKLKPLKTSKKLDLQFKLFLHAPKLYLRLAKYITKQDNF